MDFYQRFPAMFKQLYKNINPPKDTGAYLTCGRFPQLIIYNKLLNATTTYRHTEDGFDTAFQAALTITSLQWKFMQSTNMMTDIKNLDFPIKKELPQEVARSATRRIFLRNLRDTIKQGDRNFAKEMAQANNGEIIKVFKSGKREAANVASLSMITPEKIAKVENFADLRNTKPAIEVCQNIQDLTLDALKAHIMRTDLIYKDEKPALVTFLFKYLQSITQDSQNGITFGGWLTVTPGANYNPTQIFEVKNTAQEIALKPAADGQKEKEISTDALAFTILFSSRLNFSMHKEYGTKLKHVCKAALRRKI